LGTRKVQHRRNFELFEEADNIGDEFLKFQMQALKGKPFFQVLDFFVSFLIKQKRKAKSIGLLLFRKN
jgi:hypothetical protein